MAIFDRMSVRQRLATGFGAGMLAGRLHENVARFRIAG